MATGNGGTGGIVLTEYGGGNLIEQNVASGNRAHGIALVSSLGGFDLLDGNRIVRNRTNGNGRDGVRLDVIVLNAFVARNVASKNGDDGIDTDSPDALLVRNHTNRNGDLGIEAVIGVLDGGGNSALGNGNPRQCLNIFCR